MWFISYIIWRTFYYNEVKFYFHTFQSLQKASKKKFLVLFESKARFQKSPNKIVLFQISNYYWNSQTEENFVSRKKRKMKWKFYQTLLLIERKRKYWLKLVFQYLVSFFFFLKKIIILKHCYTNIPTTTW